MSKENHVCKFPKATRPGLAGGSVTVYCKCGNSSTVYFAPDANYQRAQRVAEGRENNAIEQARKKLGR